MKWHGNNPKSTVSFQHNFDLFLVYSRSFWYISFLHVATLVKVERRAKQSPSKDG